jgi:cytochrome b561
MIVHAARSGPSLRRSRSQDTVLSALYGCAAMLVISVGVQGLVDNSWLRKLAESWINIHALFGILLGILVIARYEWIVRRSPPRLPSDIRELSRHLSRTVYLMLYLVIGISECLGTANLAQGGSDTQAFDPRDDFQVFLASGLVALAIVRILAFIAWRRVRDVVGPARPALSS